MRKKREQPFAFRWEWAIRDYAPEKWSPGMMAVLYTLRTWMDNDTGHAWVSQEDLARGANVKKRQTVSDLLAQAEKDGWLVRWRNRGKGQGWALSHYRARIPPEIDSIMTEEGRPLRGPPSEKGCPIRGGRMSAQGSKDVRSGCTNSVLYNSGSAPDGAGSPDGSPGGVSLSGGEHGEGQLAGDSAAIQPEDLHLFESLTEDDRIWVASLKGRTFSPNTVSLATIAGLTSEQKRTLRLRREEREAA